MLSKIEVVRILLTGDPNMPYDDIAGVLNISRGNLSYMVSVLKARGGISSERHGYIGDLKHGTMQIHGDRFPELELAKYTGIKDIDALILEINERLVKIRKIVVEA